MSENQRILTPREQRQLIQAAEAQSAFDAMLIKTCLYHGFRNEETVSLQRKHIDLQSGEVNIERQNTKSDAGARTAQTPDFFMNEWRNWVEQYDSSEAYIFPSPRTDSHITEQYFRDTVKDAAFRADLYPPHITRDNLTGKLKEQERIRPHALRHTYGTEMYARGVPAKECADMMGHEDVETFLNLYAHLATRRSRSKVNDAWQDMGYVG